VLTFKGFTARNADTLNFTVKRRKPEEKRKQERREDDAMTEKNGLERFRGTFVNDMKNTKWLSECEGCSNQLLP